MKNNSSTIEMPRVSDPARFCDTKKWIAFFVAFFALIGFGVIASKINVLVFAAFMGCILLAFMGGACLLCCWRASEKANVSFLVQVQNDTPDMCAICLTDSVGFRSRCCEKPFHPSCITAMNFSEFTKCPLCRAVCFNEKSEP